MTLNDLEFSRV